MFTTVYLCMFTYVYPYLLVLTNDYHCWLVFTYDYHCSLVFTYIYLSQKNRSVAKTCPRGHFLDSNNESPLIKTGPRDKGTPGQF